MVRRSAFRASDQDREYIAERLRNAAAEGRILAEELEHRLEATFSARTYGELNAIVADLPCEAPRQGRPSRIPVRLRPATVVALVILFPMALALAAAALVAVLALFTAWAVAMSLAALFLGPRARALRGPWALGYRAWYTRRGQRTLGPWF
ncbi:MAG TPA: DUF1707 domain-containing protein [Solirubrobacteraceae bacterium]|nr:DUF1707 domain-containing protein [Solirubrobacteraceae bacterium]